MRRTIFLWVAALIYGLIMVRLLGILSPVFEDGSGPMPSFYWGDPPLPDPAEHRDRRAYYDLVFTVPYVVAGFIITMVGCVLAPLLLKRWKRLTPRFANTTAATLVLLLLLSAVNDAGCRLGLWVGPLLVTSFDLHSSLIWSIVLASASVLSGLVQLGFRRL